MSFCRVTEWSCDFCPAECVQASYGLPKGWYWVHKAGEETQHACPVCEKLFSNREKGRSGSNKVVADE